MTDRHKNDHDHCDRDVFKEQLELNLGYHPTTLKKHHEFIDALIDEQKSSKEFWQKVGRDVIRSGILALAGFVVLAIVFGFNAALKTYLS